MEKTDFNYDCTATKKKNHYWDACYTEVERAYDSRGSLIQNQSSRTLLRHSDSKRRPNNKSTMEVSMAGPEEWAYSRVKQASQATLKRLNFSLKARKWSLTLSAFWKSLAYNIITMCISYLPIPLKCKLHEGRNLHLVSSVIYFKCLEQCAQQWFNKLLLNEGWNEGMNKWIV